MKATASALVLLGLLAIASAARSGSRSLQEDPSDDMSHKAEKEPSNKPDKHNNMDDGPKEEPDLNKPGKNERPPGGPDNKPGKPGMPDPNNNSTCPDKWYLDKEETHECVCDQLKKCNTTGLQGEPGPQGPPGRNGTDGVDGAPGEKGRDGANGTCLGCQSDGLCAGGTFIVVAGDLASNARCRQIYDDGFNFNDNNPGNAQFDCAIAECPAGSFLTDGSCSTINGFINQAFLFEGDVTIAGRNGVFQAPIGIACSPSANNGDAIAQAICCNTQAPAVPL